MDEKDPQKFEEVTASAPNKTGEISVAPPSDYNAPKARAEQLENAHGWESDNLIHDLEKELEQSGYKRGFFDLEFKNPKHFTWLLVAFASMGGLLSGLDQSLISGANLFLPKDLHLTEQQNSLVNSGMPLGGEYLDTTNIRSKLTWDSCRWCFSHLALQRIFRSSLGYSHFLHPVHHRWCT